MHLCWPLICYNIFLVDGHIGRSELNMCWWSASNYSTHVQHGRMRAVCRRDGHSVFKVTIVSELSTRVTREVCGHIRWNISACFVVSRSLQLGNVHYVWNTDFLSLFCHLPVSCPWPNTEHQIIMKFFVIVYFSYGRWSYAHFDRVFGPDSNPYPQICFNFLAWATGMFFVVIPETVVTIYRKMTWYFSLYDIRNAGRIRGAFRKKISPFLSFPLTSLCLFIISIILLITALVFTFRSYGLCKCV
jgi:hypothetical protein